MHPWGWGTGISHGQRTQQLIDRQVQWALHGGGLVRAAASLPLFCLLNHPSQVNRRLPLGPPPLTKHPKPRPVPQKPSRSSCPTSALIGGTSPPPQPTPWGGGLRACQKSLHRLLSYTPHNAGLSQRWITYISHDMPCSKTTVRSKLGQWLRVYATWDDNRYASWHIPHSGPHTDWCGDWSTCTGARMSPQSGGGGRGPV